MSAHTSASSDETARGPAVNVAAARSEATGRGHHVSPSVPTATYASESSNIVQIAASRASQGSRPVSTHPPSILPPEKVFPIQIGTDLFRISGASISSDAPSYFTQFFEEQISENPDSHGVRTLYIDRDPSTFRDVVRHLQGYYVKPRDGSHFVKLFADAQFYSLPRLIEQLFESEIFMQIGDKDFQIPKDIFSDPGNSPNYFSLGFSVFFSTPGQVFPGLDRRGLLRPPAIAPPYVPGRSPEVFSELLHLLRGYPLHIRNESHRESLLRDCRYFHLRGLEQKVIAHEISYNSERSTSEIAIRLEDVKPSGVSFRIDPSAISSKSGSDPTVGWACYARPFVDEAAYEMIVEIGGECTFLNLNEMRATFFNLTKARVSSLLQVVANKMRSPTNASLGLMEPGDANGSIPSTISERTPLGEDGVRVSIEPATSIMLDGEKYEVDWSSDRGKAILQGLPIDEIQEPEGGENSNVEDETEHQQRRQKVDHRAKLGKPHSSKPESTTATPHEKRTSTVPQLSSKPQQPPNTTVEISHGQKRKRHPPPTTTTTTTTTTNSKPETAPMDPTSSSSSFSHQGHSAHARTTSSSSSPSSLWTIRTGQYRLRVQQSRSKTTTQVSDNNNGNESSSPQGLEIVLVAVKIDAWSHERARNDRRAFLGG